MHFTRFFLIGIIKPTVQLYFRDSSDFCGKPFKIILYLWCTTLFIIMYHLCFEKRKAEGKSCIISWQWTQELFQIFQFLQLFQFSMAYHIIQPFVKICDLLWTLVFALKLSLLYMLLSFCCCLFLNFLN